MKKYFLAIAMQCVSILLVAQTVSVADFGLSPNTFEDATEAVQQALTDCMKSKGTTLVFPKGRYDFWPDKSKKRQFFISNTSSETECPSKIKNIGVFLDGHESLTIEGNGSLFVFHGKTITFGLNHCQNIKIQNISIDFERPTISEFFIEELTPHYLIASIHPDSKYDIIDNKIRFYGENWSMNRNYFSIETDTVQGTNKYTSFDYIQNANATELSPFKVKFEGDFSKANYHEKHTITTRDHVRDHVGLFINQSKDITLDNINLHYMHGLGIVSQFSEDLTYKNINIRPRRGRTIAGFADGMHFSGCKGHIEIRDCNFKGLHDDPVNVHGTYLKISKIESPKRLTMRFMHSQTYGIDAFFEGDTVAFVQKNTLQKVGYAVVNQTKRISEREIQIELSKPLPKDITEGDCIENITWTPSLTISNCRLEMTNTRGLLVSTPRKVILENNHFYRVGMYAILIAGDANSWYESGAVNDVWIHNNLFESGGYNLYSDNNNYVIAIEPENYESIDGFWVHRNINIENNRFIVYPNNLLLKARSVAGLKFVNNRIEASSFVPSLISCEQQNEGCSSFKLNNCTDVLIDQNKFYRDKSSFQVRCVEMKKKDIKIKDKLPVNFE